MILLMKHLSEIRACGSIISVHPRSLIELQTSFVSDEYRINFIIIWILFFSFETILGLVLWNWFGRENPYQQMDSSRLIYIYLTVF